MSTQGASGETHIPVLHLICKVDVPTRALDTPDHIGDLAGRADGALTVLKGAADAGNPAASMVWKHHTVKRLGQQQILQLAVASERRLLFCLNEDGVSLFSLPQLQMKGQAARTKGATCFAWDDATNTLAVAIKRR